MRPRQQLARGIVIALLWLIARVELVTAPATADHWAFQPLAPQQVPTVSNSARVRNPVDDFVLARLEAAGLTFSPTAPSPALLRRLSFDLTGLPPSELNLRGADVFRRYGGQFHLDNLVLPRIVDQLLGSPQFGERWARWWLDAAGYVDTVTLDNDPDNVKLAHDKWRYRDYVIAAFNEDKPFDKFLREQLAGDALSDWRDVEVLGEPARTRRCCTCSDSITRAFPSHTTAATRRSPMLKSLGRGW